MHEVLPSVDPATALAVGLKVDVDALPPAVIAALRSGTLNLADPAITVELLRLNAVVGVKGSVNSSGQLTSVGVTCALCHPSADHSFAPGIGRRLDGSANRDLNVGAIVALSPMLDESTKAEFRSWGPGRYDARHHAFDGVNLISLNRSSLPVLIPPIYGLKGVGFETYTADGPISYWNSYVGVTQMGGHGSFAHPRIGLSIQQMPDLVTPKLGALLDYQRSLRPPRDRRKVSIQPLLSEASNCFATRHAAARAIRDRTSRTSSAGRCETCRCCTTHQKSARSPCTHRGRQRASTERRRCER
jgi:hypothetical protein